MNVRGFVLAVVLVGSTSLTPAGFRFLSADSPDRLERELQTAAASGYRVVAAAQGLALDGKSQFSVLLEGSPEAFEYVVLTTHGKFDDAAQQAQVNRLAGDGYRLASGSPLARKVEQTWLPDSAYEDQIVLILERPADLRETVQTFSYDTVSFTGFRRFGNELVLRGRDGYSTIALLNTGRKLSAVMEKPLGVSDGPDGDGAAYRLVLKAKRRGLKHRLNRESTQGFRVLATADQTIKAPPVVLLERGDPQAATVRYKLVKNPLKKIRKGKLERKLNKQARKGFRAERRAITSSLIAMSRPLPTPDGTRRWSYQTISSTGTTAISDRLESVTADGYRFVGMYVTGGATTILVERPPAGSAASAGQSVQNPQSVVDHRLGLNRVGLAGP